MFKLIGVLAAIGACASLGGLLALYGLGPRDPWFWIVTLPISLLGTAVIVGVTGPRR